MEPYAIRLDHSRHLLFVEVVGFWTPVIAANYLRDLAPVIETINQSTVPYDVICDATKWQVQSPAVQGLIRAYFDQPWRGHRALILPSALLRLQAARLIPTVIENEKTKVFMNRYDAVSWVTGTYVQT